MKATIYILGFLSVFILTACPSSNYQPSQKKLADNHMDFPDLKKCYYKGIHFELSDLFQKDYNAFYVLKSHSYVRRIFDLNVYFTIEAFTKNDAKQYQFVYENEIDELNAVHDFYITKREESLTKPATSIKKPLPKKVGHKGVFQVVEGSTYEDGSQSTYFTSTMKVGDKYYVFQLIGPANNMGYLHDDFIQILSSVEK